MASRSRSLKLLLLAVCGIAFALGPVGCASSKPREKWWQFWRTKKAGAVSSVYHPDKVILPPPPDSLDPNSRGGESEKLARPGDQPPGPLADLPPDMAEPEPVRREGREADLVTVHFAYDSYTLDDAAKASLDRDLAWISANPGVEIQIEGHCDETGTNEYNMLLGERRAKAVKAYLVQRGASEATLHTISYGEERPIDPAPTDAAKAKNRRAQFLVY